MYCFYLYAKEKSGEKIQYNANRPGFFLHAQKAIMPPKLCFTARVVQSGGSCLREGTVDNNKA